MTTACIAEASELAVPLIARRATDSVGTIEARRGEVEMLLFVLYVVLFLGGFYLFGMSFNAEAWQGLIFTAGILSVSLAVAILFHTQRRT